MKIKHEMAYLALRNFFVDLVDSKASSATDEMKTIANNVLEIIEESPVNSATVYHKMTLLMEAGDKIEALDKGSVLSDDDLYYFSVVSVMAHQALKEAV